MLKAFVNARIFTGEKVLDRHTLVTENDRIKAITPSGSQFNKDCEVVDIKNKTIIPGFVDLQVNGGASVLFNDQPDLEGIETVVQAHQRSGTVALLPTLISDSRETMVRMIRATETAIKQNVPGVLGVHLEGPFLNPEKKGVHDDSFFQPLNSTDIPLLSTLKSGKTLVTLAPEQTEPGVIQALSRAGICVFAGHTNADFAQTQNALSEGLRGFTHLFNAMSPLTSREPGVTGTALWDDNSYCSLINDGYHVHPAMLQLAIRAKRRGRLFLVSDAMPVAGSDDHEFVLNGQTILNESGRCTTKDGVLAGSSLTLMEAVKNTLALGVDWQEAVRMASTYPAICLGVDDDYGYVLSGYKASFSVVDDDLALHGVLIEGEFIPHAAI